MKIKICGITRPSDAELAVRLGATHVGCVMVADSPRRVAPRQAAEVFAAARKAARSTTCVLVFRSEDPSIVSRAAQDAGASWVQVHQFEEADARSLVSRGLTVCRVHDIPTGTNMLPPISPTPTEKQPAMLDVTGGTAGLTFPWEILGNEAPHFTFISGGVRPQNVCALLTHKPYGIDISSGVEREPGIKDPDRLVMLFDALTGSKGQRTR